MVLSGCPISGLDPGDAGSPIDLLITGDAAVTGEPAGAAVDRLAEDVEVSGMARRFHGHVQQHRSQRRVTALRGPPRHRAGVVDSGHGERLLGVCP